MSRSVTDALHVTAFDTALGPLAVASTPAGLVASSLPGREAVARLDAWVTRRVARTGEARVDAVGRNARAVDVLGAWLAGERTDFGDLPLVLDGTPFQCAIWSVLQRVPYGTTVTYAQLAASAGRPTAARACGAANGANRLPLVVPCHRVVAADGSLGGFSGGLDAKRALLALERRVAYGRAGRAALRQSSLSFGADPASM